MKEKSIKELLSDWRKDKLGSLTVTGIAAVFCVLLLGLQSYYLWGQYDTAYHMYAHGSSAMTVLLALLFSGTALLLLTLLLPKRQFEAAVPTSHASVRAMNLACALGCLYAAIRCITYRKELFTGGAAVAVTVLLLLACGAYFALSALLHQPMPVLQGALGFATVLMPILRVFSLYFDYTRPMESPLKLLELTGMLALSVYFLCETRTHLGIGLPRLQQVMRGIAIVALGACAVPQVVLYFITQQTYGIYTVFAVLETVIFCRFVVEKLSALLPREWDELYNYLLFGVMTTVVNLITFYLLTRVGSMEVLIANVFAWIVGVLFAYVVNKFLVFEAKERNAKAILVEFGLFVAARLLSFGAEELILFVGVYLLSGNDIVAKVIAAVVVIVLNYIASKFVIFRKKKEA